MLKRLKRAHCAPLAQLDRVSGYGPEGQGFESLTAYQRKSPETAMVSGLFLSRLLVKESSKKRAIIQL